MAQKKKRKERRGGAREGAGRKTFYPNKVQKTMSLWLTRSARDLLSAAARRNKASKSDVVNRLIEAYSDEVTFPKPTEN